MLDWLFPRVSDCLALSFRSNHSPIADAHKTVHCEQPSATLFHGLQLKLLTTNGRRDTVQADTDKGEEGLERKGKRKALHEERSQQKHLLEESMVYERL